jgi:peptidoglycan/xylan/chitin deacetylase (PgdA/CDA1 family)
MGFRKEINIVAVVATVTAGFAAAGTSALALDPVAQAPVRLAQATQLDPQPVAPVVRPAPPKASTAAPLKPVAKTTTPAAKSATAKPPVKVAKSTAAKVPPAAKKAVSLSALTGQDVIPDHKHVVTDVAPTACPGNPDAIGISRIIKVDTSGGFYVGATYHTKMPLLQPKEVILTFDDGPYPSRTDRVLAALKHECTKATFFMIGQMAKAFPAEARKVAEAGMTIGYHTMTHSYKLAKGPLPESQAEISNGWKAVDQAVYGKSGDLPMTHFFRYPGLFNNRQVDQWFNSLNMGVFAIDAEGHDWLRGFITTTDAPNVMNEALKQLEHNNGGILLLHDIKESSSNAVAPLLVELKKRGFKIVHIEPLIAPPPIATGPVTAGTIDTSPAPIANRTVDGFDPAHQLAQEKMGKVAKPSNAPAPLPAYQKKTVPAVGDVQTTQSISTMPPASAELQPLPQPAVNAAEPRDDGWFSSTARTFKGIGSAVGLW